MPALHAVEGPDGEHDVGDDTSPGAERLEGTWPHALSHHPLLTVSDVLSLVKPEFPTLSTSKLRFLDTHGLVCPHRSPAGYRQYSPADVERLRFVLRQQRDHYRPLTVIAEHLTALDEGRMQEAIAPHAVDGEQADYLSIEDIAERSGVDGSFVRELDADGIIHQAAPSLFNREVLPIVVAAGAYVRAGGDLRSMRTLRTAAQREADHATHVAAPARTRGAHGEADAAAQERAEAAISLFSAYVRGASVR